jgi:prevent-host-death family protein
MSNHSVAEAKNQLSTLIDRALEGESVVITRHGSPVVKLVKVERAGRPMTEEDIAWLRRHRVDAPLAGPDAGAFVSAMRDEDDERLLRR